MYKNQFTVRMNNQKRYRKAEIVAALEGIAD